MECACTSCPYTALPVLRSAQRRNSYREAEAGSSDKGVWPLACSVCVCASNQSQLIEECGELECAPGVGGGGVNKLSEVSVSQCLHRCQCVCVCVRESVSH